MGSSTRRFYSDFERIDAMTDEDIDFSDCPELTAELLASATFVPARPQITRQFPITAPAEVEEWFDTAPEGRDEAVLAALAEYIERHPRGA